MLEIEKIRDFIESHSQEFAFEIFGSGGWAKNVICHLDIMVDFQKLTVYGDDGGGKGVVELFRIYESQLKTPQQRTINRKVKQYNNGEMNNSVCRHWCIHKLKDGTEQFILSYLSLANYQKAIELYERGKEGK